MPITKDFDAYWREQEHEPLMVRVFGEDHELPPELKAAVIIKIVRMQVEGKKTVPEAEVLHLAEEIFGKERLDDWLEKGLTMSQLEDLIRWAMQQYSGRAAVEGAGEGNG